MCSQSHCCCCCCSSFLEVWAHSICCYDSPVSMCRTHARASCMSPRQSAFAQSATGGMQQSTCLHSLWLFPDLPWHPVRTVVFTAIEVGAVADLCYVHLEDVNAVCELSKTQATLQCLCEDPDKVRPAPSCTYARDHHTPPPLDGQILHTTTTHAHTRPPCA